MTDARTYTALAERIIAGRTSLGLTQAGLSAELGITQQAVSRWEAGSHRPTVAQIPRLAALFRIDRFELMQLACYGSTPNAAVSSQFPVDALDPETFEQFVAALLAARYPQAKINIQGSRGHAQAGTDILAVLPDGRRLSFQCKRVERFGRSQALEAIAYHRVEAEEAFLVLSKVASPILREVVAARPDWSLWDKQDLTRMVRELPVEQQERLVDIYFRGQRLALLGRAEPGPWLTAEEYFSPFQGRAAFFSHDWSLVGRAAEIEEIHAALTAEDEPIVLLVGAGGIGKTRLIRAAVDDFAKDNPSALVRFLSLAREPDPTSLEALGGGEKLLIIDDAHDREGLGLLVEHVLNPRNNARLLIASRPYAEQRIRNELSLYSVLEAPTVRLGQLDKAATADLIGEVLAVFEGEPNWAESIRSVAGDSPLVAAMAARVVAKEGLAPELARRDPNVRQIILGRFADVITGQLGPPAEAALLSHVLEVLALIQPFHVDDRRVAELIRIHRPQASDAEVSRALKLLVDGGVLYKRGQLHRLMPDLLGDFLIERSCVGADGKLTALPLTMMDALDGDRLTQFLVNLGRMDWRRTEGDPSESELLAPIWRKLRDIHQDYDPRLEAIRAVAQYQPGQALSFVEAQVRDGRRLRAFSPILRRVAFSQIHRTDALALLWELAQEDERDLNPNPDHPLRILTELISYDRHKPLFFTEEIAEFGFALMDDPLAWSGRYTPLDLLVPLLSGEGMTSTATARAVSLSPFFVDYKRVAHLRRRLIDRVIALLEADDPALAHRAACFLSHALRGPHGILNSVPSKALLRRYATEFEETMARLALLIGGGALPATTILGLIHSLSWFAEYDEGKLGDQVRAIFASLPQDLAFRFQAALTSGADYSFRGQAPFAEWNDESAWLSEFAAELLETFPDRNAIWDAFLSARAALEKAGIGIEAGGHVVGKLVELDVAAGLSLIERALAGPTPLRQYIGIALGVLLEERPDEARPRIHSLLVTDAPELRQGAVRALIGLRRAKAKSDIALLSQALAGKDPQVKSIALTALRTWKDLGDLQVIGLALSAGPGRSLGLINEVAAVLLQRRANPAAPGERSTLVDRMRGEDVKTLLEQMVSLPELDGHWIEQLIASLGKKHGPALVEFLFRRADHGFGGDAPADFELVGYSLRRGHLGLHESPQVNALLDRAWLGLRQHDESDGFQRYRLGAMFGAMFSLSSPQVVSYFDTLLDRATAADLRWIGQILRQSHHRFPMEHRQFVERFLKRCKAVEPSLVRQVCDQIGAAAMSGSWSGTPGEPMPRDLRARDEAQQVLATLSRLSPAYSLYRDILRHAGHNIARSIEEGQQMEAEN